MEVHMIVWLSLGQTFDGLKHVLRVACTKYDDPLHGGYTQLMFIQSTSDAAIMAQAEADS
jgi:hypothetical protein